MESASKARRSRGQAKALITRKLKETRELMKSGGEPEVIQQSLNKVYEYLSLLKNKHDEYLSLLADSDLEGEEDYCEVVEMEVSRVADEVKAWTSVGVNPVDLEVGQQDSVSQVASKCSTDVSTSSEGFQLKTAAKRAALSARARALKQLQELELREFRCKQERECLELEMKLAEAEAEEQQCEMFTTRKTVDQNVIHEPEVVGESMLNPEAAEWTMYNQVAARPTSVNQTEGTEDIINGPPIDDEVQFSAVPLSARAADPIEVSRPVVKGNDLAHLISQGQQHQQQMLEALQMPKAELFTYDGDPMKYWMFIRAFDNNVGCLSVDDSKKLTRLLYYCRGKALRVIQCCASMDPKIGYIKARKLLEERFGNKYVVTEAWVAKVTGGPVLDARDGDGLQEFADNLRCCKETLYAQGSMREIDSQGVMVKVVARLPAYLQTRWRKNVGDVRRLKDRMPDFSELVKFVEDSAQEANDPVYGQLNGKVKSKPSNVHHAKLGPSHVSVRNTTGNFYTEASVSRERTEGKKCFLCGSNHSLYRCRDFLHKKLEDRLKIAVEKGICFNCLSGKHRAARCKSTLSCSIPGCGKRHSHLLHRPAGNEHRNNGEVNSQPNVVIDGEASALCGSIGAGNLRIALPIVPVQVRASGRSIRTCALLDSGSTNTFCSAALLEQLGISGKKQNLSLSTLDKANSVVHTERVSLQVLDMDENNVVELPCVFKRTQLPVNISNRAQPQDISQ